VNDPRPIVVAKVGGSLLDWPELPGRLADALDRWRDSRLILLAGGGAAADAVRALDRAHHLGDGPAHALALRALDLTAHALAAIVPVLDVVESPDDCGPVWRAGRLPVLAARRWLEAEERAGRGLPHSWDVTSDSIAAYLACRLGPSALVLLKSAPLPPGTDRATAARLGLVDPAFPTISAPLSRVTFVDLRGDRRAIDLRSHPDDAERRGRHSHAERGNE